MRAVIISDTHLRGSDPRLAGDVVKLLRKADLIIHAGDFVCMEVLTFLRSLTQTAAVCGNMDRPDIAKELPWKRVVSIPGRKIGLIHGHQAHSLQHCDTARANDYSSPHLAPFYTYLEAEFPECDIIVFGHFHVPGVFRRSGRLLINPGTMAPYVRRRSCAVLTLDAGEVHAEIVYL